MIAFLHLDGVSFSYHGNPAIFENFSTSLITGRALGLLGPSGSGKTTLLRLISGLDQANSGTIRFEQPAPVLTFVSQDPVVFEHYSRYENARYREYRGAHKDRFTTERFERLAGILSLDEAFLNHQRPLLGMSGGQRQRMILLRELSIAPDLVLLDEPCTGLDTAVKRQFLLLLAELLNHLGTRCIYATHHFDEILLLADEILYLHRDANGICRGRSQSFPEFLSTPPTVDAAITALGSLTTVLKGSIISAADTRLFLFSPAAESFSGDDTLVLPPQSVVASDDGFMYKPVSRSDEVVVLQAFGQNVILSSGISPPAIRFQGDAYAFRGGNRALRVRLETRKVQSQWHVIAIPQ